MHGDLQKFINNHKKEHVSLNTRNLAVTQKISKVANQSLKFNEAIEQHAMVLTCMVEFNSI